MITSLRTRLALTYSLLILCFAIVLSLLVEQAAARRLRAEIGAGLGELAFQIADKLDRGMFERYRDLAVASVEAVLPDGAPGLGIRRAWLERLQETYPYYKWIGYADLTGKVVVSTDGILEGENVGGRPWFQGGREGVFYGDVHKALLLERFLPKGKEPWRFVDVAVPVYGAPFELGDNSVIVSSSIGIAFDNGSTTSVDELLRRDDQAMYQAKQAGRNTYRIYDAAA